MHQTWMHGSHTRGGKGMIKTLEFFGSVIPDLKWTPQELLKDGDRYIVRRIATGTPRGKFSVSSGKLASRS